MSALPQGFAAAARHHDNACDCCGAPEIDTTPIEDALHDSVPFVSEAWQELDWDALAKAWQERDALEALRLMDNAYETYKRFHIGKALEHAQPREALRKLERAYSPRNAA